MASIGFSNVVAILFKECGFVGQPNKVLKKSQKSHSQVQMSMSIGVIRVFGTFYIFLMGMIKVSRCFGLEILIKKHPRKVKSDPWNRF